ncbi:protein of unknown function [Pedobacter caeni]|uniref:DUF4249 domain-containing protein n=2 Tax=Pedobacter caeni TaxID=288992 RepID=A0A1M5NFP7_9SPHI|nr:protein of unknown function [Pedobacter caeni]
MKTSSASPLQTVINMKNIPKLLLLTLFSTLFCSCEKVIELDRADNEVKYVIEGTITNEPGVCSVLLSKTKNFKDDNQFIGVSGAVVKIENNGVAVILPESSPGVYKVNTINGTPGQTYLMTVTVDGKTFTASSTMPENVPFDDFYMKASDFGKKRTTAYVKYKDPLEPQNYYWFQLFVNDKKQRNFSLMNDEFTPGQEVNTTVSFQNETDDLSRDFKKGDKLTAEMHSIDASAYLYLHSLGNAEGSDNGASPANPISNINGGALGFFSAHTVQKRTLVIP